MRDDKVILHSDLNSFYASVETVLEPKYEGRAIAVCGSTENRHGIVLAKSEKAKKMGVKTGMVCHEARRLCPDIEIIMPHFEKYVEFSSLVKEIYYRYTDLVEPFGLDECWLDVSSSIRMFGSGETIANRIRQEVKNELGLTVSVGVSFCKSFAKLASDMKKPDAVTLISRENYKQLLKSVPASELLFVGPSMYSKMKDYGILTLGDVARLSRECAIRLFGERGGYIWDCVNGFESSPVMHRDFKFPIKSVGHGITCTADLVTLREVKQVFLELARDVGHRLKCHKLMACGVSICVKNSELGSRMHQCRLLISTRNPLDIARCAGELFEKNYGTSFKAVRALTVTAISLCDENNVCQTDLFSDFKASRRSDVLADALDDINSRYGGKKVYPLSLCEIKKLPDETSHETTLPGSSLGAFSGRK